MKTHFLPKTVCLGILTTLLVSGCKADGNPDGGKTPPEIPEGDVTVAAYYFPNWGPAESSEWKTIQEAKPYFTGHKQPKVPLWGYRNENLPEVMAQKIDAAADHGIDVFVFDWYFYDEENISGNKYLFQALEEGFLGADNNDRIKFAVMWCNHDLGNIAPGAVAPQTVDAMMDYVIEHYFKHPYYWKIDGCPYFSIYEVNSFLASFGNDYEKAAAAIARFREKVKQAGFKDLCLNGVLFGMGGIVDEAVAALGIQSVTSYVWIHHNTLPFFPYTKYEKAAERYFGSVSQGGGSNGLEKGAAALPVPYHVNVSVGWDSSPRCGAVTEEEWRARRDYPFGAVIVDNTPALFKRYLAKAKSMALKNPPGDRIVMINSWNEWGEGSYLEPDTENGTGYLEAIKDVFTTDK